MHAQNGEKNNGITEDGGDPDLRHGEFFGAGVLFGNLRTHRCAGLHADLMHAGCGKRRQKRVGYGSLLISIRCGVYGSGDFHGGLLGRIIV